MSELILIRCPRCLTDGQAPVELERLLCPVCGTTSAWQPCPVCGQRHLVVEGEAVVCPQSPLVSPPLVAPAPTPWGSTPPAESPGWSSEPTGTAAAPVPPPAPSRPRTPKKRIVWLVVALAVVVAAAIAVFFVVRSGSGDDATSVESVVRSKLKAHPEAQQQACAELRVLGPDRSQVLAMFDSLPKETRDSFVESLRQRGRDAGWLPAEAASWQWPEVRRAIVVLFDSCRTGGG